MKTKLKIYTRESLIQMESDLRDYGFKNIGKKSIRKLLMYPIFFNSEYLCKEYKKHRKDGKWTKYVIKMKISDPFIYENGSVRVLITKTWKFFDRLFK